LNIWVDADACPVVIKEILFRAAERTRITTTLVAALAGIAAPVQARDALENAVKTTIELQDGSTLYVFKDGKMAREDSFGRAVFLKAGETLKAKDGREIKAVGNEVARLDSLLREGHGG